MFNPIVGGDPGTKLQVFLNEKINVKGLIEMMVMCFEEEDFKLELFKKIEDDKEIGYKATIETNAEVKVIESQKNRPYEIIGMILEELKTMGKVNSIAIDNGETYTSEDFTNVEFDENLCNIHLVNGNTITEDINYLEISTTCFSDDFYSSSISSLKKAFDEEVYEINKVA